jgi:osmotically-inducible protein OsmY
MARKALIVMMLLFAFGCATTDPSRAEDLDPASEADVRRAIAAAVPGKAFAIDVAIDRTVVTLNGEVDSEDERRAIAGAVQKVKGVRSIVNNIAVR